MEKKMYETPEMEEIKIKVEGSLLGAGNSGGTGNEEEDL